MPALAVKERTQRLEMGGEEAGANRGRGGSAGQGDSKAGRHGQGSGISRSLDLFPDAMTQKKVSGLRHIGGSNRHGAAAALASPRATALPLLTPPGRM